MDPKRQSYAHVNGLYAPMRLIDARKLQGFGAIPTYDAALENDLLMDYPTDPLARSRSLIVFVSHRWLRGDAVLPNPDNGAGSKFSLLLEAVTILRAPFVARGEAVDVLFWIDFCSVPSADRARVAAILSLPGIMERCDVVLYPVLANESYSSQERKYWKKHSTRRFLEEVSRALDHESGDFMSQFIHCQELFSRSWVRLETLLATVVPLAPECIRWLRKNGGSRRDRPLVFCAADQRAVVLPRISRRIMHAFDPARGALSQRKDASLIEQIKSSSLASYSFAQINENDFDVPELIGSSLGTGGLGSPSPVQEIADPVSFSSSYASSSSTETRNSVELLPDDTPTNPVHPGFQRHRRNVSRFVSDFVGPEEPQVGDVSLELTGRRSKKHSNSSSSESEGKGSKKSGKTGKGTRKSVKNKSSKKGEKVALKAKLKSGHGSVLLSNGHRYSGEWRNGKIHGKGQFRYQGGGVFEGTYYKGKPHGKGRYTDASGKVELQRWENGVLIELEQLAAPEKPIDEFQRSASERSSSLVRRRLNSIRSSASKTNLLVSRSRRQSSASQVVDGNSCSIQ